MSTISSFKTTENNHDVYRGKDCMKKFCKSLEMEIINFKEKKIKLLTKKQQQSYPNAKICYKVLKKFGDKCVKDKKSQKIRDHYQYTAGYRDATHNICNLKYSAPKKIPVAFHNGSNYNYLFITKELAENFEKQFISLGENTEKYFIPFTVPIEKEVRRIDKK